MRWLALLAAVALAAVAAGCSSGPEKPKPAPLAPVVPLLKASPAWKTAIGPVAPWMVPAVQGETIVLANQAGLVLAIDADTGAERWRLAAGALSAGVGYDGQRATVVTAGNELLAIEAGKELWRQRLPARTYTAPLVAGGRVFVLGGDRQVIAFDGATGARLWSLPARNPDPLVLQQAGVLLAVGDTLLAGVGGRLVGINPNTGSLRWEAPVATPRGVNDIERLVDLVGRVSRVGNQVCVRAYQAAVGCVDAERGRTLWTQAATGASGVHGNDTLLFGTEADGRVIAWRRASGEVAWRSAQFQYRGLSAPLAAGRSIAIGDDSGNVHLISRDDGSLLNRFTTDGSPIVGAPFLVGLTMVAVTRNGAVHAWRPG